MYGIKHRNSHERTDPGQWSSIGVDAAPTWKQPKQKTQPSQAQTHKRGAWFNALRRQSNPMHFLVECTWFDVRNLNHQLCCIFCFSQIWIRNGITYSSILLFLCLFLSYFTFANYFVLETIENDFFYFNILSSVYTIYGMTHKTEMKRNSNKGRLRMVALSETSPAIIVWLATPELVVLDYRQQLCSDLKEKWLWFRPNPWLPKALMHWFLVMQSSAL